MLSKALSCTAEPWRSYVAAQSTRVSDVFRLAGAGDHRLRARCRCLVLPALRSSLSTEQLQRLAPAVFAAHPAPTTSSRYAFVLTSEVVTVLGRQGFEPVSANEKRVRVEARRGFQSHVIRFRRRGDAGQELRVGDSIYEVLLKTAHDGSSAFEFSAALYRRVCSNGLVAPAGDFGGFSVKHVGYAARDFRPRSRVQHIFPGNKVKEMRGVRPSSGLPTLPLSPCNR